MNKEQLKDVIKGVDKLIIKSETKGQLIKELGRLKGYELESERLKMHGMLEKTIDKLSTKIREIS